MPVEVSSQRRLCPWCGESLLQKLLTARVQTWLSGLHSPRTKRVPRTLGATGATGTATAVYDLVDVLPSHPELPGRCCL